MIKIFICYDYFLPAYKAGGPVQSIANMVEQVNDEVQYKIFCSHKDLDGTVIDNVPFDTKIKHNDYTDLWYTSSSKSFRRIIANEIKNEGCDILFVNGIYSQTFSLQPLLFSKVDKKILSVRGMLHPGALAQKRFKKRMYIRFLKLIGLHHQVSFHASSQEEKNYIKDIFGLRTKVSVAANIPRSFSFVKSTAKKTGSLSIATIAVISRMKNHHLILKALQQSEASIAYHIYGPVKDAGYWNECRELIQKMPANIQVTYHGDLSPVLVEKALHDVDIVALPSISENFGHSILEALSAGKPVVTSHGTPWMNLKENTAGINVSIDGEKEMEEAFNLFAAMNIEEYSKWSNGARKYCEEVIHIDEIKQDYKKMFEL